MSSENATLESFNWIKILFWTAVAVAYIFIYRHFYPDAKYFVSHPVGQIIIFSVFMMMGHVVIWRSRYFGFHVTCNGCSGSIFGRPDYVHDPLYGKDFYWAVFNLGFSILPPLRGKLGTLVLPADQIFVAGRNYVSLTLVHKRDVNFVPHSVFNFLNNNSESYNLKKVYFGKFSQEFVDNSGLDVENEQIIETQDNLINQQRKIIESKFDSFEELKELADKVSGEGTFKKFLKKIKPTEETE